ncbi:MAG: serpin family protein [Planctomycetes bacterium]|nr:serpin family protein [Planctomycetota bacterium]
MSLKTLTLLAAATAALSSTLWISAGQSDACKSRATIAVEDERKSFKDAQDKLVAADNALGFKLLADLAAADKGKNVFISPVSISTALSMTCNGAAGETAKEMANALQFGSMTESEINGGNRALRSALTGNAEIRLDIANSLWMRKGKTFKQDFLDRVAENFGVEMQSLDFADPATLSTINNWCSKNTNGKIDKILDRIATDAVMYLINAVYFKGEWKTQFDKKRTCDVDFTLADGKVVSVPMMTAKFDAKAIEGETLDAVKLPYKGGNTSMVVFVPKAGKTLAELVGSLDAATWAKWQKEFSVHKDLEINLPRFKVEYETALVEPFKKLGMKKAFGKEADFTRLDESAKIEPVFISDIRHKTFVEVNEEGTEAAAVTSVELKQECVQFAFRADCPFLYAITDEATGAILFMGVMNNPAAK